MADAHPTDVHHTDALDNEALDNDAHHNNTHRQPVSQRAAGLQSRTIGTLNGSVSVLVPPRPAPATALSDCLAALQHRWQQGGHLAALWQAWPRLAGPQLAGHCRPLRLQGGVLTVGGDPGPWLQALQYNRHQLLASLRAAGFALRDLRIERAAAMPTAAADAAAASEAWQCHPSRVDVHGMATCPCCCSPAPAGEMGRWGHCGFCRRQSLSQAQ